MAEQAMATVVSHRASSSCCQPRSDLPRGRLIPTSLRWSQVKAAQAEIEQNHPQREKTFKAKDAAALGPQDSPLQRWHGEDPGHDHPPGLYLAEQGWSPGQRLGLRRWHLAGDEHCRTHGQDKENAVPVPGRQFRAFTEHEAAAQPNPHSRKTALHDSCMIASGFLYFLENSKSSFFVQTYCLSKDFVFLPCIS